MQQTQIRLPTKRLINHPSLGQPKRPRVNSVMMTSLEFLIVLFLLVILLEILFSWSGVGEQECLKIDPLLGFNHFSNKDITWRREGFSRLRFNAHGMQDREYTEEKPAETIRIAVIGDSYVEALQVAREENFCSKLESQITDWLRQYSREEKVEVMNFGIQAHNLSQTYLHMKNSVLPFSPNLVILPYRPDATYLLPPDIRSGFLGARPNFFVDENGTLIEDRTVQNLWLKSRAAQRMQNTSWLREHSRIWGVFSIAVESTSNWWKSGGIFRNFLHPPDNQPPASQVGPADALQEETSSGWSQTNELGERSIAATWPIANALITDMAKLCDENQCKLLIVRLPGVRGHISNLETELLSKTAKVNKLGFLDLTASFHKELKTGNELFYGTHMNVRGHDITARELFEFLKNEIFKAD